MQHADGITGQRTNTMISSLNLDSDRRIITHEVRQRSLDRLRNGCNGSSTELLEKFSRSLKIFKQREASRKRMTMQSDDKARTHQQRQQIHQRDLDHDDAETQTTKLADRNGCNGSSNELKEEFLRNLKIFKQREASRQRTTMQSDDKAGTHREDEARKLEEGEATSSCESLATSTRKTPDRY